MPGSTSGLGWTPPPGRLEFLRALEEIERFVPRGACVLDLGGGPGRYTIALAERGYLRRGRPPTTDI